MKSLGKRYYTNLNYNLCPETTQVAFLEAIIGKKAVPEQGTLKSIKSKVINSMTVISN